MSESSFVACVFRTKYHLLAYVFVLPIKGNVSDVGGIVSETTSKNTANDRRTVIHRDTFSPDSGGSRNVRIATVDMTLHGNIRFRR